MDPITFFPPEVAEQILQNLSTKAILVATEVSSLWNLFIGSSPPLMKKLNLVLDPKRETKDINSLLESIRSYQSVLIKRYNQSAHEILIQGYHWRKVKVDCGLFVKDSIKILEAIHFNVEELDLYWGRFSECISPMYEFPKLKILSIDCFNAIPSSLTTCRKLKKLNIGSAFNASKLSIIQLNHIMENNNDIESATFPKNIFFECLQENPKCTMRKKMRSIHLTSCASIKNYGNIFESHTKNINLNLFLKSQKKTLENVSFEFNLDLNNLKQLLQLNNIKTLTLGSIALNGWNFIKDLPANISLQDLTILSHNLDTDILKMIAKASPNLMRLEIYTMDQNAMEFLSLNLPKLKSLSMFRLQATDFRDKNFFANLEIIKVSVADSDDICSIPQAERGHFVDLLLASFFICLD